MTTNSTQKIRNSLRGYHAALAAVLMEEHGFEVVLYFDSVNLPENVTLTIPNLEVNEDEDISQFLEGVLWDKYNFSPNDFDYEVKGNNVFISGIDWNKEYAFEEAIGSYSVDPKTGKAFDIHENYNNVDDAQTNINKNFGDTVFVKVQQSELQALNYSISSFDDTMEGAKDLARELIKADAALNSVTQNRRHEI